MRKSVLLLICVAVSLTSSAQIGYQVSLLNTATGEPRANVKVNAAVTITDSEGKAIYSGTQSSTSNDFGVLSLTVGNASTFKDADFGKLPFFIEVSVDGQMIGRSQILNVPVAEGAKKLVPAINNLSGTYKIERNEERYWEVVLNINEGKGTCSIRRGGISGLNDEIENGSCIVEGNTIYAHLDTGVLWVFRYNNGKLYGTYAY